jgi:hypothetical protein
MGVLKVVGRLLGYGAGVVGSALAGAFFVSKFGDTVIETAEKAKDKFSKNDIESEEYEIVE